jgi:hypothetical protein
LNFDRVIGEVVGACIAGNELAQADGGEGQEASGGQVLLRMGGGAEGVIGGWMKGLVIENGQADELATPGVGVCQLKGIACLDMNEGWWWIDC